MQTKIYMLKVDNNVVIGFARWANHGLASAILDARGKSRLELDNIMKRRFYSQRAQSGLRDGTFNGFTTEWLDFDDITRPIQTAMDEMNRSKPKCYAIEKREDGSLKINKIDGQLYDEDEVKVALCKMALED